MADAASEARSNDTGSLKHNAIAYIVANPSVDILTPPIARSESKSDRGFNHPVIAKMLCPRDRLAEYNADPEKRVINIMIAHSLLTFF
jgi:hypothetical protein